MRIVVFLALLLGSLVSTQGHRDLRQTPEGLAAVEQAVAPAAPAQELAAGAVEVPAAAPVVPAAATAAVQEPGAAAAVVQEPLAADAVQRPAGSHRPRLFPIISPRMPWGGDAADGPVALSEDGTPPMKSVHLARHMYSRRRTDPAGPAAGGVSAQVTCSSTQCPYRYSCYIKPKGGCATGINYYCYRCSSSYKAPVMQTLKLVPIFYGAWNDTQIGIINSFLQGLGGSPWMSMTAAYSDQTGFASNARFLNSSLSYNYNTAATKMPYGASLSDNQIWLAVQGAITAMGVAADPNAIYLLLTGPDVTASSGFCTQYCGWHNGNTIGTTRVKYAFIGNAGARCVRACIDGAVNTIATAPNGDVGVDGMLSVLAHEITETASDPWLDAWYDSSGAENGDKCAWTFGSVQTTAAGKNWNVQLSNNMTIYIQQNYYPYARGAKLAGCYLS